MRVLLDSVGNPDFGQDPGRRLPGVAPQWRQVSDLAGASRACLEFIAAHGLGSGNWRGGAVMQGEEMVGLVRYSGVVVRPEDMGKLGAEPLYDPRPPRVEEPDPHAFERARLELPGGGFVTVTGSFRIGTYEVKPEDGLIVDGSRVLVMGHVDYERGGSCKVRAGEPHPEGHLDRRVGTPRQQREMRRSIEAAIKDWYDSPDGQAMVLRNEARDLRRSADALARAAEYHQHEAAKAVEDSARLRAEADALDAAESGLAHRGPRP